MPDVPDQPLRQPWREPEPKDLTLSPVGIVPNAAGEWRCMLCSSLYPSYVVECRCGKDDEDDDTDTPYLV